MPAGYGFKDRRIAETLKQIAINSRAPGAKIKSLERTFGPEGRVRISNAAGVGIPGAGLCYADSEEYDPDVGEHLFTNVKRPTSTQHANKLIVYIGDFARTLQPEASDSDGYGWGSRLIYPEWVLATDPGDPVTPGESWGPQAGSFLALKGSTGLITTGASYTDPDTTKFYIRAYQAPLASIITGILADELTEGASATLNVDGGGTETVWDRLLTSGQTVAAGKAVIAAYSSRANKYYVLSTSCP